MSNSYSEHLEQRAENTYSYPIANFKFDTNFN